jgi:hypothetical protein
LADEDPWVRHLAVRLVEQRLCERGEQMAPAFSERLERAATQDSHRAVRLAASIVLTRSGDPRGPACLAELLNGSRRGFELDDEYTAVEVAGECGVEAAKPGLTRRAGGRWVLWPDPMVWSARIALVALGDDAARHQILRGLHAWTREQRELAVFAAGKARIIEARQRLEQMRDRERLADPETVAEALHSLTVSSNCSRNSTETRHV